MLPVELRRALKRSGPYVEAPAYSDSAVYVKLRSVIVNESFLLRRAQRDTQEVSGAVVYFFYYSCFFFRLEVTVMCAGYDKLWVFFLYIFSCCFGYARLTSEKVY